MDIVSLAGYNGENRFDLEEAVKKGIYVFQPIVIQCSILSEGRPTKDSINGKLPKDTVIEVKLPYRDATLKIQYTVNDRTLDTDVGNTRVSREEVPLSTMHKFIKEFSGAQDWDRNSGTLVTKDYVFEALPEGYEPGMQYYAKVRGRTILKILQGRTIEGLGEELDNLHNQLAHNDSNFDGDAGSRVHFEGNMLHIPRDLNDVYRRKVERIFSHL